MEISLGSEDSCLLMVSVRTAFSNLASAAYVLECVPVVLSLLGVHA